MTLAADLTAWLRPVRSARQPQRVRANALRYRRLQVTTLLVLTAMHLVELRAAARRRACEPSAETLHHEVT